MATRFMYAEMSIEERIAAFKNIAIKQEKRTYGRSLEPTEIGIEEKKFTQDAMEVETLEEQLKNIQDEYKVKIKNLEAKMKERLEIVKSGKRQVTGFLFGIPNATEGLLLWYDQFGEFIDSRALLATERQGNMFLIDQKAPENLEFTTNTDNTETHDIPHEVVKDDKGKPGDNKNFGQDFDAGGAGNVVIENDPSNPKKDAGPKDDKKAEKKTPAKKK